MRTVDLLKEAFSDAGIACMVTSESTIIFNKHLTNGEHFLEVKGLEVQINSEVTKKRPYCFATTCRANLADPRSLDKLINYIKLAHTKPKHG